MNVHVLLFARVILTLAVLALLGALVVIETFYAPANPLAQRVLDVITGGMVTLLTGSCYAWFFTANASGAQSAATIAKQSEMLASALPPVKTP